MTLTLEKRSYQDEYTWNMKVLCHFKVMPNVEGFCRQTDRMKTRSISPDLSMQGNNNGACSLYG